MRPQLLSPIFANQNNRELARPHVEALPLGCIVGSGQLSRGNRWIASGDPGQQEASFFESIDVICSHHQLLFRKTVVAIVEDQQDALPPAQRAKRHRRRLGVAVR